MNNVTQVTLAGVFQDMSTAQAAAQELKRMGFSDREVQVTHNDNYQRRDDGDGIKGFFRRMFGSDEDSGYYEREVQSGRAVVTVISDQRRMDEAIDVMNLYGAVQVDQNAAESNRLENQSNRPGKRADQSIPVVQEELQIGKRTVNRGGVRVYSRVVDQPVEENVTLREEHVKVDRHPVDRPISTSEMAGLRDQTIEVIETAEEPVVSKRARVVEEVAVGKEATERTETIRDKVRRTEVNVENLGRTKDTRAGSRQDLDREFRQDYDARFASSGVPFDTYLPAYQYGYTAASDPRYQGRSWSDVESELQRDYTRRNPNSTWENMRAAVRHGWEKITGRTSAA
jgi:uncharacterized protein (TIGR02271 family)